MEEGLQEMMDLPGVEACVVYDNQARSMSKLGALRFNREQVAQIGDLVVGTLASLNAGDMRAEDVDLAYENLRVLIKDLEEAVLVVLCEPDVDISMLRMTINVTCSRWEEDPEIQRYLQRHAVERRSAEDLFHHVSRTNK